MCQRTGIGGMWVSVISGNKENEERLMRVFLN